jgi:hypothetical protein
MKYIKPYEQFRLLLEKLDHQGKNLFLLCGPSATGKTYLAGQIGINHWTKSSDFKGDCLITSDGEDGEMEKITQLLEAKGCPKLAEISKSNDNFLFINLSGGNWGNNKDVYKKWEDESEDSEKEILKPYWDMATNQNSLCPNTQQQDSRVFKLALISYLWGPGKILFDDVRPTINNFYNGVKEHIIYTPITTYLSDNLSKRLIKEPNMNIEGKIQKFFEWFQLSETPDSSFPDNKKYTIQEIDAAYNTLLKNKPIDDIDKYGTGSPIRGMVNTEFGDIANLNKILSGNKEMKDFISISKITDKMKEDGFYFKKGGIQGDKDKSPVFNSRSGKNLSL